MLSKLIQIFLVLALGGLFAILFSAPVRKINLFYGNHISFLRHRKKWRNILAVLSWYLFLLLFLIVTLGLLYYNIYQYFTLISWDEFMDKVNSNVNMALTTFPFLKNIGIEKYAAAFFDSLIKLPGIIAKVAVGIMISIYLLMDWDFYMNGFRKWKKDCFSKKWGHMISSILYETKDVLFGYLKGQSLDSLVMGVLISVGLWLLKVPLGVPIGILAGAGNMIPYVGPIIAYSLTVFFCLLEGRTKTMIIAVIYLAIIQQIDGSYIGPKLLGKQMQIRPLFIIVSILVGGTLFGPIGMLFAVPAAAILKTTVKLLQRECCS